MAVPTIARPCAFRLSLVIPAWNEQETIRQAVQEAAAALEAVAADYEIIVVDDGSRDATADLVRAEAVANPRVRLVQHGGNRGYGAALRTGFQAAQLDLVAFTDADCQFNLADLEYVLPLTGRYDVVTGYRINRQDPLPRRFVSWGYNNLVKVLVGSPVHDLDCALKIFHREQLPALLPQANNFFVNTEMLTQARHQGLTVVEVGVNHRPRAAGRSKVSMRDVPRTLAALLPYWWTRIMFPAAAPSPARADARCWVGLLLLALLAGLLLFPNLSYPLIEPDEARYAEIAREMAASGDWITPTLNHQPYYDKPPLLYWLVAGTFGLFGTYAWAARLAPAGAAFATVLITYLFGRRMVGPRAGFLAGLMLVLMVGFIECGRFLVLDSLLALFVAMSLFLAYEALQGPQFRWGSWLASAACCGLGVLTKGPVAVALLLPPVVAHAWLNRLPATPRWRHWLAYAGVVAGLAAPWFVAIALRDATFVRHFIVEHHLARYLGGAFHDQPFWYYGAILLLGCLPWSLLLLYLVRFLCSRSRAAARLRSTAMGFGVLWVGWCLLFFSLSRSKLPPYILPAVPGLALLLGSFLDVVLFRSGSESLFVQVRRRVPQLTALLLGAVWLVALAWAWLQGISEPTESWGELAEAAICLLGLGAILCWGTRLPARAAWGLCGTLGFFLLFDLANDFVPGWASKRSPLARSQQIEEILDDGQTGLVCVGEEWGSIPFYLHHEELLFNSRNKTPEQLKHFLDLHPRTLFLVRNESDMALARWLVPAGSEFTNVLQSGQARFVLVQAARNKR